MIRILLTLLLWIATVCSAYPYEIVERQFEVNVQRSDLVVIGTAVSERHQIKGDTSGLSFVTIAVHEVLKGKTINQLELLVTPEDVEFDPRCCCQGASYLLLLDEIELARFTAVNGRFGVHRIDEDGQPLCESPN